MKKRLSSAGLLFLSFLLLFAAQTYAKSIMYDEVIFAPAKIVTFEGGHFLEFQSFDGSVYEISFENYASLKAKIEQALQETDDENKHIAFYLKLGTIVDASPFHKESVHIYKNYAETKTYFAISASFMDADARLRLKVTKEENPLSYKISEKFLEEYTEAHVYFTDGELIHIEKMHHE